MKRITGAFALLAGLSGCVAFTVPIAQGDKRPVDPRTVVSAPMHGGTAPPGLSPLAAQPPAVLPSSPGRAPTGWVPLPELPPATPAAPRAVNTGTGDFQRGMPMAVTPPKSDADSGTRQAGHQTTPAATAAKVGLGMLPEIISGAPGEKQARAKPAAPTTSPPSLPSPAVKNSTPAPADASLSAKLGGAPLLRLVNSKRITLNFEVKDVGPSGLAGVNLWYTRDGRDWKKHEAPANAQAYVIEVDEEGTYGFTLVARSGIGLGKEPPAAGDQPQVWVIVDLSKPDVQLAEVTPNYMKKRQQVSVRWQASDKNLGRQPVTLSYAEKEEGPWQVIAANLDTTGQYVWQVPKGVPPRVLLRVEAADLAGNVGRAQSDKPILMDSSRPNVSIVNVEANASR